MPSAIELYEPKRTWRSALIDLGIVSGAFLSLFLIVWFTGKHIHICS